MSPAARAYYGAVLGALLTMVVHPVSRPYVLSGFLHWGDSPAAHTTPWIVGNVPRLPVPKSALDASLWLQAGAERLWARRPPSDAELESLIEVARSAGLEEPENAYWTQMEAVFLGVLGRLQEADRAWMRAARAARWNDLQGARLIRVREDLARESGARMAWQLAYVYRLRSLANAQVIRAFGRAAVLRAGNAILAVRWAGVSNARLMRDGARSIEGGQVAADMMEAVSHPAGLAFTNSHRVLLLARYDLVNALAAEKRLEMSSQVAQAYDANDSWLGMTQRFDSQERIDLLSIFALAAITAPSALLAVAGFGGVLWLLGLWATSSARVRLLFAPPLAPWIGVASAVAAYAATGLTLAPIAVVLCYVFLVFTPPQVRTLTPTDLGPLFRTVLGGLGCAMAVFFGAFFGSLSTPACELLAAIGLPRDYYGGATLFLGLAGIVLCMLPLMAPGWALVQRVPTPKVVAYALRALGRGLCSAALGIAVVVGPLAVYADRELNHTMQMLEGADRSAKLNQAVELPLD